LSERKLDKTYFHTDQQGEISKMAFQKQPQVTNPQVAKAPGEEALEAVSSQAELGTFETDNAALLKGMLKFSDQEEYVDEP
jgi:hypothetical protein